jgi:hypothetical protein
MQGSFDTFGAGGAEAARAQAQRDAASRPSIIPGPVLDEVVVPVVDSTGLWMLKCVCVCVCVTQVGIAGWSCWQDMR